MNIKLLISLAYQRNLINVCVGNKEETKKEGRKTMERERWVREEQMSWSEEERDR
jgi:hypothetical protein